MTDWQSHPTFRGLVAAGADDAYALDLAAEWLEEAMAELPDVLRWYAGGPPLWHHEDDAQRAGVLWRWLRLVEPEWPFSAYRAGRWELIRDYHEPQLVGPLSVKRHALQLFPEVEAEVTFRGRVTLPHLLSIGPGDTHICVSVEQEGGATRFFMAGVEAANVPPGWRGDYIPLLPAPQWIGEEDVARAAMMTAARYIRRDTEMEGVAGEELSAGDYVYQAPDGRVYRGDIHPRFGRALHDAPAGGAVRVIPPATTRPSGRQRFINLAGDVVEIDEIGQMTLITHPAAPPAPPPGPTGTLYGVPVVVEPAHPRTRRATPAPAPSAEELPPVVLSTLRERGLEPGAAPRRRVDAGSFGGRPWGRMICHCQNEPVVALRDLPARVRPVTMLELDSAVFAFPPRGSRRYWFGQCPGCHTLYWASAAV